MSKKSSDNFSRLLDSAITRRDFLNAMLLGAGAGLLSLEAPGLLFAATKPPPPFGGVGDYALSAGNTEEVLRMFQAIEQGRYHALGNVTDTGETYGLAVAGGGLSGLAAAYEFNKRASKRSRCIVLENHPIFGGTAKRNEFIVQGERLMGPQASNAFGVINHPDVEGYDIYKGLGVPTKFYYKEFPPKLSSPEFSPLEFDATNFGYRLWFTSDSIGYYFDQGEKQNKGQGLWARGLWENMFSGAPYTAKQRADFLRWRGTDKIQYEGKDYEQWLDTLTYKQYLEDVMKLDPSVTRFTDPVLASVVGLGCDAISAYTARQVLMPGFPEFSGHTSLKKSHWHSFPGGNDGFSRFFVKALIPDAIKGGKNFEDIHNNPVNFPSLDRKQNRVSLRLGASVVSVKNQGSGKDKSVSVVYERGGRLFRLKASGLVMATGSRVARRVVRDLPSEYLEAQGGLQVAPILVANVALTNWRFMHRLGMTACKWYSGFGFSCNIRKPMIVGKYSPPLHPDKPIVLTFYVSFHQPGLTAKEQCRRGRRKLLQTSYAQYEEQIVGQMHKLFSASGFDAKKDIAGIVLNRWLHAYVIPEPGFYFGKDGKPALRDVIRKPFGRIAFAHAELNGHQNWVAATTEGRRAARQVVKRRWF